MATQRILKIRRDYNKWVANETMEGSDFVGLMMYVNGRVQTPVFTDDDAQEIDSTQYQTGVGPCIDSYRDSAVYGAPITAT